ncbi:hypothetical protein LVJ94_50400 [Pendulispora rubella]|uniref:Tetratricopeptide repeat protein n=1 Tax=Pendulispora rubella TaxID=2741070 RepID=A0ABZ2L2C1_9BACT
MRTMDEERWISIVAAEARGVRIGPDDAEFRRSYEAANVPEVAEEAAFWADLGRLGSAREASEMSDEAMAQRILSMNEHTRPSPRWSRATVRRAVATLLAAVAIAATLVVLAAEMMHRRERMQVPQVEDAATATPPPPARKPMSSAAPELVPEPAPEPAASHREGTRHQPAKAEAHSERSAEALLNDAQMLVAAGRTDEAMVAYRVLIERYPQSVEARASRVTLGRLSLARNEAAAALGEFDRYLEGGGGSLEAEARYGRIRALQKLSRDDDERAAIMEFLARHGDSVHAEPLRARLENIKSN